MAQEIEEGSHCSEEKRVMAPGHQIPRIEFTNAGPPPSPEIHVPLLPECSD